MIKYSIIIPVYQCEAYLEECVRSAAEQESSSLHEMEIILVDDGSADRSGQIADQLSLEYPFVHAFHQVNEGAAGARNRGIREANGQYILFIDGDDTVDKDLLKSIDGVLEVSQPDLVIFGMAFDYYRGDLLRRTENLSCSRKGECSLQEIAESYRELFYDNALSSACNKVFSADIISEYDLCFRNGMTLYEDYDFVLRYLQHVKRVHFLDVPFYHYRNIEEQSHFQSRVSDLDRVRVNLSCLMESAASLCECPECRPVKESVYGTFVNLYMQMFMNHLLQREYTVEDLKAAAEEYCADTGFRRLLQQGALLDEREGNLLDRVDEQRFHDIVLEYKKRRIKAAVRAFAKTALQRVGLRQ